MFSFSRQQQRRGRRRRRRLTGGRRAATRMKRLWPVMVLWARRSRCLTWPKLTSFLDPKAKNETHQRSLLESDELLWTDFANLYLLSDSADVFLFCFMLPADSPETPHPVLPGKSVSDFSCFWNRASGLCFRSASLCRMKRPAEAPQMGSARWATVRHLSYFMKTNLIGSLLFMLILPPVGGECYCLFILTNFISYFIF